MKTNGQILIVEDEPLIYQRLKMLLEKHNYSVHEYTKSVKEAIASINKKRPDLALLDIDLHGEHTGIHLGRLLHEEYKIPFIFVTELNDDQNFYAGLQINQKDFIDKEQIKSVIDASYEMLPTKPILDEQRLIRSVQMALNTKDSLPSVLKDSIILLRDFKKNMKEDSIDTVSQVPINYEDILYFTTNLNEPEDREGAKKGNRDYKYSNANYARAFTKTDKSYYINRSLSKILERVPHTFVRINNSYVVNLSNKHSFQGRINGSRITIGSGENPEVLNISDRYKEEVEKRLRSLYEHMT